MTRSILFQAALCALFLPTLACKLLDVEDPENANGRGARVFDPYQSSNSGALRLALLQYNGCAALPTGQTLQRNSAIPAEHYPASCPSLQDFPGLPPTNFPPGSLQIVAGENYFLNQFSILENVMNLHTDTTDMSGVVHWITKESRFKSLDWSNVGQVSDEWLFYSGAQGLAQDMWYRRVLFDNANWRNVKDDEFHVEILDAEGNPKAEQRFKRSEFMVDSAAGNHTSFGWQLESVAAPAFPGDKSVRPLPQVTGWAPQQPAFRTFARFEVVGSTNPFKTIRMPDLRGDAAIRVTWSQMKDTPFYFPVTFVTRQDLPATCWDPSGTTKVPCGFGIDPNLRFIAPRNGQGYYEPGETLNFFLDLRDDQNNRLHEPDLMPSGFEFASGQTNGVLYYNLPYLANTLDQDMIPMISVAGPLHKLKLRSDPNNPKDSYFGDGYPYSPIAETATTTLGTAEHTQKWPTRFTRKLPENAEAGTYVALVKWHRAFGGERVAKIKPHFFQVGTTKKTTYPGNVGNCQICHRGVLSLDNLRHGLSVDHVEACKSCHHYVTEAGGRISSFIHKIHTRSPRFTAAPNDCTVCHLTRESATRPSIDVCSTCHPSVHGDEFFSSKFSAKAEPNRFGNCAQSCHQENPPQSHILPEN